jgi:hypothetical protein
MAGHAGTATQNNPRLLDEPEASPRWWCRLNALRAGVIWSILKNTVAIRDKRGSGLFEFWLRFGSVTGSPWTCSVAKASPEPKNPRSEWLQNFFKRSRSVNLDAARILGRGLSSAHDAVKLFSLVPNSLKWLQRIVRRRLKSEKL